MKKWIWITVPAVAVGLGLVFIGGSAFAQNAGNTTTTGVKWNAMYDYCRNIFSGNTTVTDNDLTGMRSYCQNATASGNFGPDDMMGSAGMMGTGGMMGGYTGVGANGPGGMMGSRSTGPGMMGW